MGSRSTSSSARAVPLPRSPRRSPGALRDLVRQISDGLAVRILRDVVSATTSTSTSPAHTQHAVSGLVRRIKGRSACKLLEEYPSLKERYWGGHFWGIGYGAWSTGEIAEAVVQEYQEHHRHRERPNDPGDFILE